jgi:hypothetical protein
MKKRVITLVLSLLIVTQLGAAALAVETSEVRIPVTISYSEPIAGAQLGLQFSSGLTLKRFEKAAAIGSGNFEPNNPQEKENTT